MKKRILTLISVSSKILFSTMIVFSLIIDQAHARSVILAWNPSTTSISPPPDIYYRIHMGSSTKNYSVHEDATLIQMQNGVVIHEREVPFPDNVNVYFAATAFIVDATTKQRQESGFSNEVVQVGKIKLLPPNRPEIIGNTDNTNLAQTESPIAEYGLVVSSSDNNINSILSQLPVDENGNPTVPEAIREYLSLKFPGIKTGDILLVVELNPTNDQIL